MHMTELESKLAQPDAEELRRRLIQQLAGTELRLRRQLAASLPRHQFADCAAAADAAQAAQEVLQAWPVAQPAIPGLQFPSPTPRSSP